jgi:hypothetical protein
MWEPGTAPPGGSGKKSSNKKQSKKNTASSSSHQLEVTGNILASPKESKSTPKRLSGATMNMRFMKRKEETRQQERERERKRLSMDGGSRSAPVASTSSPSAMASPPANAAAASASPLSQPSTPAVPSTNNDTSQQHPEDAMEVDEVVTSSTGNSKFQVATPVDMYGMQASLIGRRSFGGFNAAMEDAWKESKGSLEDRSDQAKKVKVSDEELIQRYQDIVKKRSDSSRAVGNLRDKGKPKRQRR